MAFTEEEAAYLRSQPLARIATVGPDGQPDVAPVGFEFDGTYLYVGGRAPERTRKFLNVKAGQAKVALVVDDLVSTDPWTPRGLRVYGIGRADRAGRHVRARRVHADHPGDLVELEPGRPALRQRVRPAPDRPLISPNGPGACPAAAPSSPGRKNAQLRAVGTDRG